MALSVLFMSEVLLLRLTGIRVTQWKLYIVWSIYEISYVTLSARFTDWVSKSRCRTSINQRLLLNLISEMKNMLQIDLISHSTMMYVRQKPLLLSSPQPLYKLKCVNLWIWSILFFLSSFCSIKLCLVYPLYNLMDNRLTLHMKPVFLEVKHVQSHDPVTGWQASLDH